MDESSLNSSFTVIYPTKNIIPDKTISKTIVEIPLGIFVCLSIKFIAGWSIRATTHAAINGLIRGTTYFPK